MSPLLSPRVMANYMTTRSTSKKLYFAYGSCMDYQGSGRIWIVGT